LKFFAGSNFRDFTENSGKRKSFFTKVSSFKVC